MATPEARSCRLTISAARTDVVLVIPRTVRPSSAEPTLSSFLLHDPLYPLILPAELEILPIVRERLDRVFAVKLVEHAQIVVRLGQRRFQRDGFAICLF